MIIVNLLKYLYRKKKYPYWRTAGLGQKLNNPKDAYSSEQKNNECSRTFVCDPPCDRVDDIR